MIRLIHSAGGSIGPWMIPLGSILIAGFFDRISGKANSGQPRGLAELERVLRSWAAGQWEALPQVAADDPAAEAAGLALDVVRRLRERPGRADRRSSQINEALEAFGDHGLVILDRDLVVRIASQGFARMTRERLIDLEGRPIKASLEADSYKDLAALVTDLRRERKPFRTELTLTTREGNSFAARVHGAFAPEPAEGLALLFEAGPAVAAGEDPREALERQRAILNALADGVIVVRGGEILEANPAVENWLGGPLIGTRLRDRLAAEDLLLVLERVARAEQGETVDPLSCRMLPIAREGKVREVELHAVPTVMNGRRAAAVTLRDRTLERRADRRALLQEARLVAVLEAVGEGLALFTPPAAPGQAWRVGLVNQRLVDFARLDGATLVGCPEPEFRSLIAYQFENPAAIAALLDRGAREPSGVHQGSFELAGGGALDVTLRPVKSHDGEALGRILVIRDISHHKERERQMVADAAALARSKESLQEAYDQLARLNEDLERKSGELDRLNRELVDLDRARAHVLADVSHELQTPLVSIRGYTQMILEGRLGKINDEQRQGLSAALRNVDRMVELISNLLALARSERPVPLKPELLAASPVIAEVLERQAGRAQSHEVTLESRIDDPNALITAEREGLVQVLDNLVSNGIKFNRPGGRVVVSLQSGPNGYVEIRVADTGIGINAEDRERVFERFYRGRQAAGISGSGIGLATVKNILDRHGAHVELNSQVGEGTVFRVFWPRQGAPAAVQTIRQPGPPAP